MAFGDAVLGPNQYGKAECRLVRIDRGTPAHRITDLNVTTQLRGDFTDCHTHGDNAQVVATDTQKNTLYAFAREHGIGSLETFLITVARHFVDSFPWVSGAQLWAEQYAWDRIEVDGRGHDHAFRRTGGGTRTAVVQVDGDELFVIAGLTGCTVLKSAGSEFHGFPRDRFTTLPDTTDRILATSVTARWRYRPEAAAAMGPEEFDDTFAAVEAELLEAFARVHSLALQQTIFEVGKAILDRFDAVAEIRLSCPNKHHFLVDLEPFGMDNPGEVFFAADRPYGLIQAAVQREGEPDEPRAWDAVPGFC